MKTRDGIRARPLPPKYVIAAVEKWGLEKEIAQGCYRHIGLMDGKDLVGLVTMFPYHPYKPGCYVVEHARWKPGLNARRKLDAMCEMIREVSRQQTQLIGYTRRDDFKFFNTIKKLGCLRKVGKQSAGFESSVTVWETPPSLLPSKTD